ncbi:unnamed protein product [Effrenium voratum]|nr:unnamed protein product [Effrenium voratum]
MAAAADSATPAKAATTESTYQISLADGSELSVTLPADASARELYLAVAAAKAMPMHRLKLVVKGHPAPLPLSQDVKVAEAAGGERDFLLVLTKGVTLGRGLPDKGYSLEDVSFEHYSVDCYASGPDESSGETLELCEGKKFTVAATSTRGAYTGLVFDQCPFQDQELEPLVGKVLIRVLLHHHAWAFGVGVSTRGPRGPVKDPEHNASFAGLYHGGNSINCCAWGRRYHWGRGDWEADQKLAMVVDLEARELQCFEGRMPFGPACPLDGQELWPALAFSSRGGAVSLSVTAMAADVMTRQAQTGHKADVADSTTAVRAADASKPTESTVYQISLFDGSELSVTLPADASTRELYLAVAAAKAMPMHRLKLVVKGHPAPLPLSQDVKVAEAAGGERDFLLVLTKGVTLGRGLPDEGYLLEDVSFEHYSVACYASSPGESSGETLELCEGKRFTVAATSTRGSYMGLVFDQCPFEVLIRVLLHHHAWAFGVGVSRLV